ncbi:MAG: hypothetical protein ACOYN6_13330 [Ignavibacteria bacterium]
MDEVNLQTEQVVKQDSPQKATGLVSKLLTLLLTLLFFLPWFTFKACNMTYEYSGYSTVVFQPSNDIGQFTEKMSELGKNLSDKKEDKTSNKSGGNDFTIISAISALIAFLLAITIFIAYFMYNGKTITILSSVKSLLFLIIIAVLLYDKSKIPPDSKGMVGISIEFGLILSFIISAIIIFSNKIESGLIISDPNSIVTKIYNIFQKKFIGLIGIGIILIGLLLAFVGSGSAEKTSSKDLGLGDKMKSENNSTADDLKKRELELKQKELELKEKELNKQTSQEPNLNTPDGVVTKFIQSLGKQDWSSAYALMTEKRRGNYSNFTSTKAYGGIISTKIYSCSYTGESNGKKEVMVDYDSIDPANKSGRFKQYYYLTPNGNSYLITDIKNINIEWH